MDTLEKLRAGELAGATRLDLHNLSLTQVPSEVFTLANSLEVLNLSGNQLTSLPDELPRLHRLKVLFCSNNPFDELPKVLGSCTALEMIGFKACQIARVPAQALPPRLRWLILTDNRIGELPNGFERFPRLQKLMLAGNHLKQLPPSLSQCHELELLRLASNELQALPSWLFSLPKLAWLAYAGNPCCPPSSSPPTPTQGISWHDLTLGQKLGEGASGMVYQATLGNAPAAVPVAVKVFKGMRTSDGLPADEIAACLQAGHHPNLVPMRGPLTEHPQALPGLVMDLISPAYQMLAGPPTLDSCTRDAYCDDARFSLTQARALLLGAAQAATHLHRHGVMHGDLYGHNLMVRGDGHALLGDFGAASRYLPDNSPMADALQGIEVRAFGILLAEVLLRCQDPAVGWQALSEACQQPNVAARPRFADVVTALG